MDNPLELLEAAAVVARDTFSNEREMGRCGASLGRQCDLRKGHTGPHKTVDWAGVARRLHALAKTSDPG